MRKWVITGGLGFIGYNLCQTLGAFGNNELFVIDDLSNSAVTVEEFMKLPCKVTVCKGDIRNVDFSSEFVDATNIVHLAANTGVYPSVMNPIKDAEVNILGTMRVLETARKHDSIQSVVLASSGAAVGDHDPPLHEKLHPNPVSPYGVSKMCGEFYGDVYNKIFGLNVVSLRFSNVYGPFSNNKNSLVARMIKSGMDGSKFLINGDGEQTRDFVFVDDVVDAIVEASIDKMSGVYHISTGLETSVNYMFDLVQYCMKERGKSIHLSGYVKLPSGDVSRNFASYDAARKAFNWKPKVELKEGISKTVDWFMKNENK